MESRIDRATRRAGLTLIFIIWIGWPGAIALLMANAAKAVGYNAWVSSIVFTVAVILIQGLTQALLLRPKAEVEQ